MEKIKITSLNIKLNNVEFPLDIEDAKELYDQLFEIFGKKYSLPTLPIIIEKPYWHYNPYSPGWFTDKDGAYATTGTNNVRIEYRGNYSEY